MNEDEIASKYFLRIEELVNAMEGLGENFDDKLEFSFNAKAMNAILNALAESEFVKVMHLDSTKAMWDKLIKNY